MKTVAAFALLWLSLSLPAQVATDANSGYRTEQQRKGLAQALGNPERDNLQKPGQIVKDIGLTPGMAVADVGTGIGYMLPYLSRAVGPTGKVIAEDIFEDFLEGARQRSQTARLNNVMFVKGTAADPNLPAALDVVLALDVYHHFDYPEKMLAAIYKALKPAGRLVVVEYYKRPEAMSNGRAMTHIRLDMPDVIKEIEANKFHLVMEKETIKNSQYMLVLEKSESK